MRHLLAALFLTLFAHAADAAVAPGDRVRVTLIERPKAPVVGTLLSHEPGSLTLAVEPDSAESTLARPTLKRLEISQGMHSNAGRGAKVGALVGFTVMFALGAKAGGDPYDNPYPWYVMGPIYGVLGALTGTGVGAIVGSFSEHERWKPVQYPR